MPRLSIVIAALGDTPALESTLVSVLENRPHDCEVVVVLGQAYNDPYDLKNEVRFIDAPRGAGLVACANLGVSMCRAPLVHLLATGCEVGEGWADSALAHFADPRVAAVAPLAFRLHDPERVVAAGISFSRGGAKRLNRRVSPAASRVATAVFGAPAFAAFYRKSAWELAGGLCSEVGDELADIDLACTVRQAGFTAVLEPASSVWVRDETIRRSRGYRAGLHAERLFWRNAPRTGWFGSMLAHLVTVVVELAMNVARPAMLTQLAGRLVGCCRLGDYARHHHQVQQLAAEPTILRAHGAMQFRVDNSHGALQNKDSSARVKAG